MGNWQAAEELIVSPDEQEDLEYLIGRERRLGRDVERAELHRDRPRDDGGGYGGDGAAAAPTPFAGDGHEEEETHEADFNELNPAAEAAAREEAAGARRRARRRSTTCGAASRSDDVAQYDERRHAVNDLEEGASVVVVAKLTKHKIRAEPARRWAPRQSMPQYRRSNFS